jgi:hypothetical protein
MKHIPTLLFALVLMASSCTSEKIASPAQTTDGRIGSVQIEINYGAPSAKGREIFGALVPYNEVWRTGANENTTISFSESVNILGQDVPGGTYGLFTTPGRDQWMLHLNSEYEEWGAYSYNDQNNILSKAILPKKADSFQEQLLFSIDGTSVRLSWADLVLDIPIEPAH